MKRCVALLGVGLAVVVGPVDGWASPPASPRLYRFGRGLMWTDGVRYAARGTTADRVRVYDTSTGRSFAVGRPGPCDAPASPYWAIGGGMLMFACNYREATVGAAPVHSPLPVLYDLQRRSYRMPAQPRQALGYRDSTVVFRAVGRYWIDYGGDVVTYPGEGYESFLDWRTGDVNSVGARGWYEATDLNAPALIRHLCAPFQRSLGGAKPTFGPFVYQPPYGVWIDEDGVKPEALLRCGRARPLVRCDCAIDLGGGVATWSVQSVDGSGRELVDVWAVKLKSGQRYRWRFRASQRPAVAHTANRIYITLANTNTLTRHLP